MVIITMLRENIPRRYRLADQEAVIRFIKAHHEAPQLVITDQRDQQLLLMRDGVDLFNDLDRIGISLQAVLNQIREEIVEENAPAR